MVEEKQKRGSQNWIRIVDWALFFALLALISAVTLILFYRQATAVPEGAYHSDIKAYILEMLGQDSGYEFPYPVFFKIGAFFHLFVSPELAIALAAAMLNSLAVFFVKWYLNRLVLPLFQESCASPAADLGAGVLISLSGAALFFISMLYPPEGIYLPGILNKYLGVFTPNPYHNATYLAARPFAVLSFFAFGKLLASYEKGALTKGNPDGVPAADYVLFSLFLLAATMTKPSFTIILAGAGGLVMLFRFFRSRGKNLIPSLQLGLCFLPTFVDLLYQYKGVFVPSGGDEGGIGFSFGTVWRLYCHNIPLAIGLAVGFPLLTLLFHIRELKTDPLYRFSWQLYLISFVMAFFLYEKGFRVTHFNFSWGYMYGIFFCHLGSLMVLLRDTSRIRSTLTQAALSASQKLLRTLITASQWLAFLWHTACGLAYFCDLFQGKMYY